VGQSRRWGKIMTHLHAIFLYAAYAVFVVAILWDYLAPRFAYKKTLRTIVLKSLRKAPKS
jgi:hypothetical protein